MRLGISIGFSSQEYTVNSSTVPYNIALTGQNKKEIACAQNLIISRNDGERKPTSTMVNDRRRLQMMKMNDRESTKKRVQFRTRDVQWRWYCVRAPCPSQEIDAPISHTTTTKTTTYHDKASNRPPKCADNDRQHRQTKKDNQQSTKKRVQFAA